MRSKAVAMSCAIIRTVPPWSPGRWRTPSLRNVDGHEQDVVALVVVGHVRVLLPEVRERVLDDVVLGIAHEHEPARAVQDIMELSRRALARSHGGTLAPRSRTEDRPKEREHR